MRNNMIKNAVIYFAAALAVLAMKIFYRTADCGALLWILAPTTWWVQLLSGIPFEWLAHVGYVSHEYQFVIAASCSGVRFLMIAFVMLVCSFTHQMDSWGKKLSWLGFCAVFSYIATVLVNGIRITLSIYLPIMLGKDVLPMWLTAERLHTMIGTVIYFSMLIGIYWLVWSVCRPADTCAGTKDGNIREAAGRTKRFAAPVFWYFVMVLGIPFLGRLYRNDWAGFWPYALLVSGICILLVLMFMLLGSVVRSIRGTKPSTHRC